MPEQPRPPDPDPVGDLVRPLPGRQPQDDPGPHHQPGLLGPGAGQPLQLRPLLGGQLPQLDRRRHNAPPQEEVPTVCRIGGWNHLAAATRV
jgi:hypothetical protein